MEKESVSIEFRFKRIGGTRNYLLEEIKHNYVMSEKHEKVGCFKITASTFLFLFQLPVYMSQFLVLLH